MNTNTEPDITSGETAAIPLALAEARAGEGAVILARVVRGVSAGLWPEVAASHSLDKWHVFPVSEKEAEAFDALPVPGGLPVSPFREVEGALTEAMFSRLLRRELLRLGRNGGCLSLISGGVIKMDADSGGDRLEQLKKLLGWAFLGQMDACDTLGILRRDSFVCSLPGMGQLAARAFAEKIRQTFAEKAGLLMKSEKTAAGCALGIVNVLQGEGGNPAELLKRARVSLEMALAKESGHIHQETSVSPLENTTLVQSSEKRFLFFGGEAS